MNIKKYTSRTFKRIRHQVKKIKLINNPIPYEIRIIKKRSRKKIKNEIYIKIGIAFILVLIMLPVALFTDYITTSAFLVDRETRLAQYLAAQDVPVGKTLDTDGFEQIFFSFEDEEKLVTNSRTAKGEPQTDEEYITWMEEKNGTWQIFLYHIPTEKTMQLTRSGNNIKPKISNGNVVWQGWDADEQNPDGSIGNWQVFMYDGKVIRQISQGYLTESPDVENDFIVFSQRYNEGWKVYGYSIRTGSLQEILPGFSEGNFVDLRDGDIFYGRDTSNKTRFNRKINELFLLDLPFDSEPGQPQTADPQDMRSYLEQLIQDAEQLESSRQNQTPVQQELDIEQIVEDIESPEAATGSAEVQTATTSGELQ